MIPREIPPSVMEAYSRLRDLTQETETKLRHVRDADFWGAPVGTPLPLPGKLPTLYVPASRSDLEDLDQACEMDTSYADLPEPAKAHVNDSEKGTSENPAHRYDAEDGISVDVSVEDCVNHLNEILDIAEEGYGVKVVKGELRRVKRADTIWEDGKQWYQRAHDEYVVPWAKEYGVSEEVVAAVIAATSPQCGWDLNLVHAERVLQRFHDGLYDGLTLEEAANISPKTNTVPCGMQAIEACRTGSADHITGSKRRSFTNNLLNPQAGYDVTVDGWMAAMCWRMDPANSIRGKHALSWLTHTKKYPRKKGQKGPSEDMPAEAGYIIISEACRKVAEQRGLRPCEVQAIYWVAVGGGTHESMYPKGERYTSSVSTKSARIRAPWPYTDVNLDPTGGDLTDPDYWDAEWLRIEEEDGTHRTMHSAWWALDGRYEWPDQNPRAVVLAKQGELKALLAGFQEAETKLRHVRDAAYWGAPVGTPLPLPRAIKPSTVTIAPSVVPDLDSLPEVPMKKIYRHYGPEKRPNPSKEAIQELADQFNDPPPDHLTDAQKKMHRKALKMRAKRLLMHRARWGKRKPVRHDRRMMNIETLRSGDLMMAVSPKNAMRVLREGASKNLFHTGKSISRDTDGWGVDIVSERLILEKALFDIPIDAPPDAHPAYGYLALDDALPNVTSGYGSVVFKLKPSAKEHATVSLMDTFGVEDEPPPMCIPVPMTGEVTPSQLDMAHDEDEGGWADRENLNRGITRNNYAEVQVHGGYTVDEIDTIYLRSTQWQNEERRKKTLAQYEEIKALAEKLGIRVVVERDA